MVGILFPISWLIFILIGAGVISGTAVLAVQFVAGFFGPEWRLSHEPGTNPNGTWGR